MADEPVSADEPVISVDRLSRAAKYAESRGLGVYLILEAGGIRVSAIRAREFASRTVTWAEMQAPTSLKRAIDEVADDITGKTR